MADSRRFLLGIVIIACFSWLAASRCFLDRFEDLALDAFFRARPPLQTDPSIVCIALDDEDQKEIGTYPWPRGIHARLVEILSRWGARAVVFDVVFPGSSSEEEDSALEEALRASERVYLPAFLRPSGGPPSWLAPIPRFAQVAKGVGHLNMVEDRDGVQRRFLPFLSDGQTSRLHLGLLVASDVLGRGQPKDENQRVVVNWAGRWAQTFKRYSYRDIVAIDQAIKQGVTPPVPPEAFRDKICVIGFTSRVAGDFKSTPVDRHLPGLGGLANVLNNALTGLHVVSTSPWQRAASIAAVGLLALLTVVPFRGWFSAGACGFIGLLWAVAAFAVFCAKSYWIGMVHPASEIAVLFLASFLSSHRAP